MSKYLQVIGPLKGEDGKSAYQYAQDGGYTGTEAEFAEKLAAEGDTYTLPIATETALGGVKPVTKTDAMTQEIGVDEAGALWAAIAYPVTDTTDAEKELSPNTYYKWGEMSILTITLGSEIAGIVNEFCGEFVSGETATTFSVPESVSWPNGLTVDANKTYQFSIVNGVGVIVGA